MLFWRLLRHLSTRPTLHDEEPVSVQVLKNHLSEDELAIVIASYGMSERDAAASLGMAKTTYRERLVRARERAAALLKTL